MAVDTEVINTGRKRVRADSSIASETDFLFSPAFLSCGNSNSPAVKKIVESPNKINI